MALALRPYAARPARAARQVLADVLVVVWVVVWVRVGRSVHDTVDALAVQGTKLHDGASGLAGSLGSAASGAARLPLVGSRLATPLRGADSSATQVADAGTRLATGIHELAGVLGVVVVLVPVLLVVVLWLPVRLRFALRAGEAAAALAGLGPEAATRLLAVRSLSRARLGRLARVSGDPVADVADGDPLVLHDLAALERRRLGLRG